MAPPPNRRTGFSRKAQYTTFFGYAAGVLGALVGAGLLLIAIIAPGTFSALRTGAATVAEPAGGTVARARGESRSLSEIVAGYVTSGPRVAKMERELAEARRRLAKSEATEVENRRLRALLGLREQQANPVTVTRITGSTGSSSRRYATIGAGASAGVSIGMPVRSDRGLIGRVLEVGSGAARVLLITDGDSQVPVVRASDGIAAIAQGLGNGMVRVRLINLGRNPLKPGDIFVTSGSGGLFHPGTPVAVVHRLTNDGADARVLSRPADTRYVIVEPISEGATDAAELESELAAREAQPE